jgi:HSP20 family protein
MANTLTTKREEISPIFDRFFDFTDPFNELTSVRKTMNTLLDNVMRPLTFREFAVPMDFYNKDGKYYIEMSLPGVEKKDVNIEIEGNCLTVAGNYASERQEEEKDKRFHYRELRRGGFSRSVTFPEDIDPEKVVATFDRGILKVEIPSLKPARTQKVAIK